MTREEAANMAKAYLQCLERDSSGVDSMCNCGKCADCNLNYEKGNVGEIKEWLRIAIKALEKPILDEVIAEIEHHRRKVKSIDTYDLMGDCLEIIERVRRKTHEENGNM